MKGLRYPHDVRDSVSSMQGGYGYPPQQQQWQQPMPVQHAPPHAPPPKKGSGGLIALVLITLLLVGGGIAAAVVYFVVLAKPAPHLAAYVPKNASVYVELPSVKRSIVSAATMKPLDASRVDDKVMTLELDTAFARAFALPQGDAHSLVSALDAAAFVARDTNNAGKAALIISFTGTAPVEKLLHSPRFSESGAFLGGGMRFSLLARSSFEISPNAGPIEIALSDMKTGRHSEDLIWFAKKKLLVWGDDQIVTDIGSVIGGSADSLEKNDAYKNAKRTFEGGADVAFFFDTHDLDDVRDPSSKKLLDGWIQNRDPVTGAIKLVKAGVMMDAHATLTGTSLPPGDLVPPASKLVYPHKLPAETVAYMALSTKTKMNGSAIRAMLFKSVDEADATSGRELRSNLDAMERSVGFKLDDLVDLAGDEAAMAIVVDPAFKLDTTNGVVDELTSFGVVYALAVKDDAKAKMVLAKLRAQLETPDLASYVKVSSLPDGWEADPQTAATFPVPNLTVRYDGKQVVAVLASPAIAKRAFDALMSNKATLATNPAHELAFGALPQDANFYMWLDTGRITSVMLDGASHAKRAATPTLLPADAIRLTGPDRVTSALAIRTTQKTGVWTVDIDSLNLPATALFSATKDIDLSSAMPKGPLFGPGTGTSL